MLIDETPVYGSVTIEKPVIIKVAHTLGGSAFFTINGIEPNFASEAFPATGLQVSTSVALKVAAYSPNFDKVERTELVVTRVDPHRYTLQVTRVPPREAL